MMGLGFFPRGVGCGWCTITREVPSHQAAFFPPIPPRALSHADSLLFSTPHVKPTQKEETFLNAGACACMHPCLCVCAKRKFVVCACVSVRNVSSLMLTSCMFGARAAPRPQYDSTRWWNSKRVASWPRARRWRWPTRRRLQLARRRSFGGRVAPASPLAPPRLLTTR